MTWDSNPVVISLLFSLLPSFVGGWELANTHHDPGRTGWGGSQRKLESQQTYVLVLSVSLTQPTTVDKCLVLSGSLK